MKALIIGGAGFVGAFPTIGGGMKSNGKALRYVRD